MRMFWSNRAAIVSCVWLEGGGGVFPVTLCVAGWVGGWVGVGESGAMDGWMDGWVGGERNLVQLRVGIDWTRVSLIIGTCVCQLGGRRDSR